MRVFSRPTTIGRLSREARVVYSGFCVLLLCAYASSAALYLDDGFGLGSKAVRAYYLGDDAAAAAPSSSAAGPRLELPDDGETSLRLRKPPRQLLETFHFHAFSMGIVLLILAHLFMMCGLTTSVKIGIVVAAHVGTIAHLAAPLLVRFVSPDFAWLMAPSALLLAVTWLVMTLWPLVEMWRGPAPPLGQPG